MSIAAMRTFAPHGNRVHGAARGGSTGSVRGPATIGVVDLFERRAKLAVHRAEISAAPTRREGEATPIGPDSTTLFSFGEAVKAVLTAWEFPDAEKVQFDGTTNDITISGKPRSANGKGVRAVLHAAFNVAVFVHCIENKLPHPDFWRSTLHF